MSYINTSTCILMDGVTLRGMFIATDFTRNENCVIKKFVVIPK